MPSKASLTAVEAAALFVVTHEGQHDAAERVRRALA